MVRFTSDLTGTVTTERIAFGRNRQVNATDGRFDEAADHFAKAMEASLGRSAEQRRAGRSTEYVRSMLE